MDLSKRTGKLLARLPVTLALLFFQIEQNAIMISNERSVTNEPTGGFCGCKLSFDWQAVVDFGRAWFARDLRGCLDWLVWAAKLSLDCQFGVDSCRPVSAVYSSEGMIEQ